MSIFISRNIKSIKLAHLHIGIQTCMLNLFEMQSAEHFMLSIRNALHFSF